MNAPADRFVRVTTATDLAAVRTLLKYAALPTTDLKAAKDLRFWVLVESGIVVGAIGLERFGSSGLLRSLVVSSDRRRHGLGQELVGKLEHEAAANNVNMLVMLTETAQIFFSRLGYAVIDRTSAPDEIKVSAEFRLLCPASAVCMSKVLISSGQRHA